MCISTSFSFHVVLLCAVMWTVQYAHCSDQSPASHVKALGGEVSVLASPDVGDYVHVNLCRLTCNDSDLQIVSALEGLNAIDLSGTQVSGDGLRALQRCKSLIAIDINDMSFGDGDVKGFPQLESVTHLGIGGNTMSAVGYAALAHKFVNLKSLSLGNTTFSPGCMAAIVRGFPHIEKLELGACKLTADSLECIGTLAQLKYLGLGDSDVKSNDFVRIAGLHKLESLDLSSTGVTDCDMKRFVGRGSLRSLDVSSTSVTGAGLSSCLRLEELRMADTPVTVDGIRALQSLSHLHYLCVGGEAVNSEIVDEIGGLKLSTLLVFTGARRVDVSPLWRMVHLRRLVLMSVVLGERGMMGCDDASGLVELELIEMRVSERDWWTIGRCAPLRKLSVSGIPLTTDVALTLLQIHQLEQLTVKGAGISPGAKEILAGARGKIRVILE